MSNGRILTAHGQKLEAHGWWRQDLARIFPLLAVCHTHRPRDFVVDILAGIILSVVLIPETIAYASLAGLPATTGLYMAIVPFFVYALVGPSRQLVVASVAVTSLMVGHTLGKHNLSPEQYVACATILSLVGGISFLGFGVARAGYLESFISHAVLKGFAAAAALIIAATQLPHLVGIRLAQGSSSHNIFSTVYSTSIRLREWNWITLVIAMVGIAVIVVCKRRSPLIPGPLISILLGVGIMYTAGRVAGAEVETIGEIKSALPHLVIPPLTSPWIFTGEVTLADLVRKGLVISLVSFIETLSVAKIMAGRTGSRIDANRELIALGFANLAGAFFQCYPASGSLSKTSTSYLAGTRSQWAAMTAVVMVILALLFLTPYLARVPRACLAAIVMVAVSHLIDIPTLVRAFKVKKADGLIIVVTFLTTLAQGVEAGIILGLIASFAVIIWQTAHPRIAILGRVAGTEASFHDVELCQAETWHDLIMVKVEGPLYFSNAQQVENTIINLLADTQGVRAVILDASAITDLDTSGEGVLWALLHLMIVREAQFILAGVTKPVLDILRKSGFADFFGPENFYPALPQAVAAMRGSQEEGENSR
jgi:SulP family sulfate permease